MLYEAHPPIVDTVLDRAIHDGSRYLELRRSDARIELHALVGGSWSPLQVEADMATRFWDWAAWRLTEAAQTKDRAAMRSSCAELLGNFRVPIGDSGTAATQLMIRLRWLSRKPLEAGHQGTIALRLVESGESRLPAHSQSALASNARGGDSHSYR